MQKDWSTNSVEVKRGWFYRRECIAELLPERLRDQRQLDAALANSDAVFKHDRTTTVARINFGDQSIVLKRYNPRTLGHAFSRALRLTRARRCWKMSHAFNRAGLRVAQPIMMFEQRFGPIRLNAYFASELLDGEELLSALPKLTAPEQVSVVDAIKDAFAKMRAAKVTHGDMKASNIIWNDGELKFIDLDAALKHRTMITWNASHAKDKKRFLKNWQDQPELLALFADLH